jgi:hypothetical protein
MFLLVPCMSASVAMDRTAPFPTPPQASLRWPLFAGSITSNWLPWKQLADMKNSPLPNCGSTHGSIESVVGECAGQRDMGGALVVSPGDAAAGKILI